MNEAETCSVCGDLPASLTVLTGMGEYVPGAIHSLAPLGLGNDQDLLRCPACDALFHWEDRPQFYGSGNLDEELLNRLSNDQAAAARSLLSLDGGSAITPAVLARA